MPHWIEHGRKEAPHRLCKPESLLRVHCPTGPATRTATIVRSLLVIAGVFRANRLERVRQEEVANRLDLEQQVAWWVKSQNFRAYLKAVEQEAVQREISIAPEAPLGRWPAWAREHADRLDPLAADLPSMPLS